jgi:hypothetical protein
MAYGIKVLRISDKITASEELWDGHLARQQARSMFHKYLTIN